MKKGFKYIVGIDEAGRGPLAGPVSVGAVLVPAGFDFSVLGDVRDSKKVSEKRREEVYRRAKQHHRQGTIRIAVSLVSVEVINKVGITGAVSLGIVRALRKLKVDPKDVTVLLDGLLHAPQDFNDQQTIVRGDQKEPAISLASIMAKVTRDRHMVRLAKRYPAYGFEVHKGYGTADHRKKIRLHGAIQEHRTLFTRRLLNR